jgi:hypothetical protein
MGRACSMHGGEEEMLIEFWWESQKERDRQVDQDLYYWALFLML